jgi:hypothetical protein
MLTLLLGYFTGNTKKVLHLLESVHLHELLTDLFS